MKSKTSINAAKSTESASSDNTAMSWRRKVSGEVVVAEENAGARTREVRWDWETDRFYETVNDDRVSRTPALFAVRLELVP